MLNIKKLVLEKKMKSYNYQIFDCLFLYIVDTLLFLRYSIKWIFTFKGHKNLNKLKKFKDMGLGQNAFVIANGPSLLNVDFNKILKYQKEFDYKIFVLNSYSISPNSKIIIPNYYILSDPSYFLNNNKISQKRKEELNLDLKYIIRHNIITFVPIQFLSEAKDIGLNAYGFNDFEYKWGKSNISPLYSRSYTSMTAYKALAMSVFLNFDKIYIGGFDNSYFKSISVDKDNNVYYFNSHAYAQKDSAKYNNTEKGIRGLGDLLKIHSFLFSDLAQFPQNKIVNLDKNGLIDAFTKSHQLDIYVESYKENDVK